MLSVTFTYVGGFFSPEQARHIRPVMKKPSKLREEHCSEFGFNGNIVSYVSKKGKAVVLLSNMHDEKM